jgi:hypothetical protein
MYMDSKEIEIMQRPRQSYKALAAEQWFGYGRWAAPYWFVGMEPGGQDDARVSWRCSASTKPGSPATVSRRFTVENVPGPERAPGSGAAPRRRRAPDVIRPVLLAVPVSVGRPSPDAAGGVKGAAGERSDPLTPPAMLPQRPTEGAPQPTMSEQATDQGGRAAGRRSNGKLPRS